MTSPHEREKLMRQFRHEPAYALAIALKCAAALLIMILVAVIGVHTHLHSDVMADRPDVRRHDSAVAGDSGQILNERQAPIALHEGVGEPTASAPTQGDGSFSVRPAGPEGR